MIKVHRGGCNVNLTLPLPVDFENDAGSVGKTSQRNKPRAEQIRSSINKESAGSGIYLARKEDNVRK
jgi:hypothetical protein